MIEVREEGPAAVVISCANSGEAEAVVRCVTMAVGLGHTRLVVDLGDRSGADADLLDLLHRSGQQMHDVGGRLAVVSSDSGFRRLLDLTLLSQGFRVYSTREEALAG